MTNAIDRRGLLTTLVAGGAALSLPVRLAAQEAGLITGSACFVQPETTEGPFYVDPDLIRSSIAEDRPGVPMRMRLQVVQADCSPIDGARVDVWHCDAGGIYSSVPGLGSGGQTFLRGTQITGSDGVATFDSIYPGWYPGRTPHVHYKVFLDDRTVLTSQFYFPDDATAELYLTAAPYDRRGAPDRVNETDGLARRAGPTAIAAVAGDAAGTDVALVIGVAEDPLSSS